MVTNAVPATVHVVLFSIAPGRILRMRASEGAEIMCSVSSNGDSVDPSGFALLCDLLAARLRDLDLELTFRQGQHDAARITDPIWHRLHRYFQIHRVLRLVEPGS